MHPFTLKKFLPSPSLQNLVQHYWYMHVPAMYTLQTREILHSGTIQLLFHLGSSPVHLECQGKVYTLGPYSAVVVGHHVQAIRVRPPCPELNLLGVVFINEGLHHLLRFPMAAFRQDYFLPADQVLGERILRLCDAIPEVTGIQPRFDLVNAWLQRFCRVEYTRDPVVEGYLRGLLRDNPALKVDHWAAHLSVSPSTFQRRMNAIIGLSPKEYSRLVRFYRLYHQYVLEPGAGIMDLVVHFGYFDHMHLLKDFHFFLRTAPSRIEAAAIQEDVRLIDQIIRVR